MFLTGGKSTLGSKCKYLEILREREALTGNFWLVAGMATGRHQSTAIWAAPWRLFRLELFPLIQRKHTPEAK